MNIDLVRATREDAPALTNLLQFYVYDLSDVVDATVGPDGRFSTPSLDPYWSDPWRHPHLVRVDGHLAGFALVHQRSRITGDPQTWDVAEFFIMRKYRRHNVGSTVAKRLFDTFRGPWEVRQLKSNQAATSFWRKVISRYTKGNFEEQLLDNDCWQGPMQSFHS